jgi:CBS domain-containing protein
MHDKAQNIMTKKLITISVDAKLSEAAAIMRENRIRHLPVTDEKDGIIGVLSSKDLLNFPEIKDIPLGFFMSSPVRYVNQDLPLKQAIYKMLENKISSLIVSDTEGMAVGIITTDDLLWYLVSKLDKDGDSKAVSLLEGLFSKDTVGKVANQLSTMGI